MDPAIIVFGLLVGVMIGMTGMGGASLMTPLLILIFGINPVTAIGTDIFYGAVTKSVGGYNHLRRGTVHRALALWLAIGAVPAALGGVWVIELLESAYGEERLKQLVLGMLGAALLVVGLVTLLRSVFLADSLRERYAMHLYGRHIVAAVATGAVTGFVIGMTSAGGGTLVAVALIVIFRLTPQRVVGTSVVQAAVVLWAAGTAHWIGGNVDFALAGNILLGSVPGVIAGTHLAVRAPQALLRILLGVVLIGSAIALIAEDGTPDVVIPSVAVAVLVMGSVLAAGHLSRGRRGREPAANAAGP